MDKDDQVQLPTPAIGAPGAGAGANSRLTKPRFSCRRWYLLTGNDKDDAAISSRSATHQHHQKPSSPSSPFLPATSPRPPITKQWGELTGVYAPRQPRSNQRQREAERRRLRDRIYLPSVQHTLQRFRRPQTQTPAPFQGPAAISLLRVPPIGTDLLSDRLHSLRSSLEADPPAQMAPTPTLWCPQPPRRDQRPTAQRPQPGGRGPHRIREARSSDMKDSFEQLLEDAESDTATSMSSLETHVCAALSDTDTADSLSSLETHVCAALEAREYAINAIHGYLTGTESDASLADGSSISPSNTQSNISLMSSESQRDGDAEHTTDISQNDSASAVSSQPSMESMRSQSAWSANSINVSQESVVAPENTTECLKEQDLVVADVVKDMVNATWSSPTEEVPSGGLQALAPCSTEQQDSCATSSTQPQAIPPFVPAPSISSPVQTPTEAANTPIPQPAADTSERVHTSANPMITLEGDAAVVSNAQDHGIVGLLQGMVDLITLMNGELLEEHVSDSNHHQLAEEEDGVDSNPISLSVDAEVTPDEQRANGEEDYAEAEFFSEVQADELPLQDPTPATSVLPVLDCVRDDLAPQVVIQEAEINSITLEIIRASPETGPMEMPDAVPSYNDEPEVGSPESDHAETTGLSDIKPTESEVGVIAVLAKSLQVADADDDDDYEELGSEQGEPEATDLDPGNPSVPPIVMSDATEKSEPDETYADDEEEYAGDPDAAQLLNDYEADFDFDADDEDSPEYAFDEEDE